MASEKLRSIRRYLFRNARALDVARWNYHFEDGPVQDILKALACYQNTDGGFGHGLEPDIRTAGSNPMSTWAATRILREAGLPAMARLMVDRTLDYLAATLQDNDRWPATTPAHDDGLHAPWFNHQEEEAFWGWNPTIELAAFILLTGENRPALAARAEGILKEAFPKIMDPDFIPSAHELSNIAETAAILLTIRPELLPDGFTDHLKKLIGQLVNDDSDAYDSDEYIVTPEFVLDSPQSPWYPAIRDTADFYADRLESRVTPEGYWEIRWDWGDQEFPADAVRDWRGSLILQHMLYLQHFKPEQDEAGRFLERS